ncbi:peptide ABC transporter substrate-binding protein [Lacticaseibacillus pabuli]|uniref:Peptide ABC transporter substrate-binding protein n=1 Tax=Lacticaseibacillus pabuli TaxID=3025672 RepID=A0ABY7WU48_9LACO|nr:peptide ABC transporter substrate-binding protein [Lacticaseibacillus sp. KACC 23028]WDF83697.1 peptide ABC transporter substrate-binding protein [Lacticaseibacillus sp. KACC 23028]
MQLKKYVVGLMTAISAALLIGCGTHKASNHTQEVSVMADDTISTMDPARGTDANSAQTMANVYAGLYRYSGKELVPDMAARQASVSTDKRTYTFTLRHNARWSDGSPVTAADFVYAWRRVVDPATKSDNASLFAGIQNATQITAGKLPASQLGVQATGKRTLVVHLERPLAYFAPLMAQSAFYPVQHRLVRRYADSFGTNNHTVSFNGPFVLGKWDESSNQWTVRRNPHYWDHSRVQLDQIVTRVVKSSGQARKLFDAGKLDDVTLTGAAARGATRSAAFNVVPQNATFYLEMNAQRVPAFGNQQIRQALSQAINRQDFIKKVLGDSSLPAYTVIPTGMTTNTDNGTDFADQAASGVRVYTAYDPIAARDLLQKGMRAVGAKTLRFTIVGSDTDSAKQSLTYLKRSFERLSSNGIKVQVDVQSVALKTRVAMSESHTADTVVSAWNANYPDPSTFLNLFTKNSPYNSGQWSNAQYDRLVARMAATDSTNTKARWRDQLQATKLLTQQLGVIPLYQRGATHLTSTSVKDIFLSPNGIINYIGVSKVNS